MKKQHFGARWNESVRGTEENLLQRAANKGFAVTAAVLCGALILSLGVSARALEQHQPAEASQLETGFHLLYELKPAEARAQLDAWQKQHPEDPLVSALQAANYLLEECYRQGVLTSEFFLDDKPGEKLKVDPAERAGFLASFQRAQDLARERLKAAPNDANALFAITMSLGMQANYAALIENRKVESLKMMGDAAKYARQLLAIDSHAADAYLALGASNYIVGSLPGHQRFFLGLKGIHGDEKEGIRQLEIAATNGHYLRPFAKMLLALASLKQKKPDAARALFAELSAEFPANPLFASELSKLGKPAGSPLATSAGP